MQTEDSTSETDIPTGSGFGYPPQIFTDPTHTADTAHIESEEVVKPQTTFLGRYCEYCDRCRETHCWCFSSDWEEEQINVTNPISNPSIETTPSPTVRKSPIGWSETRCTVIREADQTKLPSLTEEVSTNSGTGMQ